MQNIHIITKKDIAESVIRVGRKNKSLFFSVAFGYFDDDKPKYNKEFAIEVKKDLMETWNLPCLDLHDSFITSVCEMRGRELWIIIGK